MPRARAELQRIFREGFLMLTLLMFEEFHLLEALRCFLFRFIRPAQVFSLAGNHFVSTRYFLIMSPPPSLLSRI